VSSLTDTTSREPDRPLLRVDDLKKHFTQSDGVVDRLLNDTETVHAVDGVSFGLDRGETLGFVGESGCGKSTLAKTLIGIHEATEGTIRYRDSDITGFSGTELKQYRNDVQMIFQDPLSSLNPRKTIGKLIKAPMEAHDIGDTDEERTERAKQLLKRVGLKPAHISRHPHQFSGGQQQRIAIARALTLEPELLIADEPVSALDVSVQAQVLKLLQDLQAEFGLSILFIAHDLSVIRYIADRVAVMYLGEIVEMGPTETLFEAPEHPYTRSLLSAVPRVNRPESDEGRTVLRGEVPSPIDPPSGCRFHTRCPEVIPPDEWEGSQEAFKAAFDFRSRIFNQEVEAAAVRQRLSAGQERVTDEDVRDQVIQELLPLELERFPSDVQGVIRATARHAVNEDWDQAQEQITHIISSPCEAGAEEVEIDATHRVSCLRAGETDYPAAADD
jgi:peptide/nickel transport system ATP-binding protein